MSAQDSIFRHFIGSTNAEKINGRVNKNEKDTPFYSYMHISMDNRIHMWDASLNKKNSLTYIDRNHLSHKFTCLSWRPINTTQQEQNDSDQTSLAIGFDDGVVLLWNLSRGIVSCTIDGMGQSNSSASYPTDVCWSNNGKSIFISYSQQPEIVQYDSNTGELIKTIKAGKKGILKLAMNPKLDVLAAASSSVKIVDVASGRKKKLLSSFSGGVNAMTFTSCGRFLICSSSRNHEVIIFDVQAIAQVSPILILPVNGIPLGFDTICLFNPVSQKKDIIEVLCIFQENGGCYIRFFANYVPEMRSQEDERIISESKVVVYTSTIVTDSALLAGRIINEKDQSSIASHNNSSNEKINNKNTGGRFAVVASGSKSNPIFQKIQLCDEQGNILDPINLLSINHSNGAELSGKSDKNKKNSITDNNDSEIIGPFQISGVKRPTVETLTETTENGTVSSNVKKIKNKGKDVSDQETEVTLEQRLANLSNSLKQLEDSNSLTTSVSDKNTSLSAAPTSDSLAALIEQAIQSGDDGLLEQCLATNDAAVIYATVDRLPVTRVINLLRKLVAKFEKRPSRGATLLSWLRALLQSHTSYLVTIPDVTYQLAGLSQILETRLTSYSKMTVLSGRLDLLLSQSRLQNNLQSNTKKESKVEPMIICREE
eukprot:gene10777-14470_t